MAAETALVRERCTLPRHDAESLARLTETARRVRPIVLARDRVLPVPGTLGELLPDAALRRGEVVTVEGEVGAGATSIALAFAAAATAAGEWAAVVGIERRGPRAPNGLSAGDLGAAAALEAGVALERLAVVRRVPPARWATTVDVLLDGMSLVVAEVPRHLRVGDARRLEARTRERGGVLIALAGPSSRWPAGATARLRVEGGPWPGLGAGHGLLTPRSPQVRVADHGTRERVGVLAG